MDPCRRTAPGMVTRAASPARLLVPRRPDLIEGKDIVVVQAMGMYLMGQAFFSAQLLNRFDPRSVESVALVAEDDEVLRPLFEQYPGMRVVVCPPPAELPLPDLVRDRLTSASRRGRRAVAPDAECPQSEGAG